MRASTRQKWCRDEVHVSRLLHRYLVEVPHLDAPAVSVRFNAEARVLQPTGFVSQQAKNIHRFLSHAGLERDHQAVRHRQRVNRLVRERLGNRPSKQVWHSAQVFKQQRAIIAPCSTHLKVAKVVAQVVACHVRGKIGKRPKPVLLRNDLVYIGEPIYMLASSTHARECKREEMQHPCEVLPHMGRSIPARGLCQGGINQVFASMEKRGDRVRHSECDRVTRKRSCCIAKSGKNCRTLLVAKALVRHPSRQAALTSQLGQFLEAVCASRKIRHDVAVGSVGRPLGVVREDVESLGLALAVKHARRNGPHGSIHLDRHTTNIRIDSRPSHHQMVRA